jgi:hypothetical protein
MFSIVDTGGSDEARIRQDGLILIFLGHNFSDIVGDRKITLVTIGTNFNHYLI